MKVFPRTRDGPVAHLHLLPVKERRCIPGVDVPGTTPSAGDGPASGLWHPRRVQAESTRILSKGV